MKGLIDVSESTQNGTTNDPNGGYSTRAYNPCTDDSCLALGGAHAGTGGRGLTQAMSCFVCVECYVGRNEIIILFIGKQLHWPTVCRVRNPIFIHARISGSRRLRNRERRRANSPPVAHNPVYEWKWIACRWRYWVLCRRWKWRKCACSRRKYKGTATRE